MDFDVRVSVQLASIIIFLWDQVCVSSNFGGQAYLCVLSISQFSIGIVIDIYLIMNIGIGLLNLVTIDFNIF